MVDYCQGEGSFRRFSMIEAPFRYPRGDQKEERRREETSEREEITKKTQVSPRFLYIEITARDRQPDRSGNKFDKSICSTVTTWWRESAAITLFSIVQSNSEMQEIFKIQHVLIYNYILVIS